MRIVPLKANFKKMLESITRKRIEHATMNASTPAKANLGELHGLARLTRMVTRGPVELEPPGKRRTIIMHTDIDPRTGKLYKDFEERRRKLREASKEPSCAGTYDGWKPDE